MLTSRVKHLSRLIWCYDWTQVRILCSRCTKYKIRNQPREVGKRGIKVSSPNLTMNGMWNSDIRVSESNSRADTTGVALQGHAMCYRVKVGWNTSGWSIYCSIRSIVGGWWLPPTKVIDMEVWSSGLRQQSWKLPTVLSRPWVRIPEPPP